MFISDNKIVRIIIDWFNDFVLFEITMTKKIEKIVIEKIVIFPRLEFIVVLRVYNTYITMLK